MSKPVILCVDDEIGILKSLERCLNLGNYEVLRALGAEEALQLLEERSGKVDVIIADQRMPNMPGDEFLKRVKGRFGRIPSIMLSGYAELEPLMRAMGEGEISRLVAKPWDNRELLRIVDGMIRDSQGDGR